MNTLERIFETEIRNFSLKCIISIVAPLRLPQQIYDAQTWKQTAKAERLQSDEDEPEYDGEREHGDWEKHITPLNAGRLVLLGSFDCFAAGARRIFAGGAGNWRLDRQSDAETPGRTWYAFCPVLR